MLIPQFEGAAFLISPYQEQPRNLPVKIAGLFVFGSGKGGGEGSTRGWFGVQMKSVCRNSIKSWKGG